MTRTDDELDQYGKRLLAPLRDIPSLELPLATQEKAKFMRQGDDFRLDLASQSNQKGQFLHRSLLSVFQHRPAMSLVRIMAAVLLALVILVGSSFTVYAAQSSLPGEPLYAVKSWSEDVRLSLKSTPQSKLDLLLSFTNRRASEISQLALSGIVLSDQTSVRYQSELDSALQLAAEMDDAHLGLALGQIKKQAESQGMTLEELISSLPEQAAPAIAHLQERLQEQVDLSTLGEHDPQAFRTQVRDRQHGHQGQLKDTPASAEPGISPTQGSLIPEATQSGNDNGDVKQKPSEPPGHGKPDGDGGNSNSGNGKHGPSPTDSPAP